MPCEVSLVPLISTRYFRLLVLHPPSRTQSFTFSGSKFIEYTDLQHMPASDMEIMPNQHPHEVLHYEQPRRHVVCLDIWETIFDMVQGSTDSDVPPILAACAGVCQELRCIAEGRLYKHLILGDKPGINTYLFRQVRPIHTEEISYLLRKRHLKSAINGELFGTWVVYM